MQDQELDVTVVLHPNDAAHENFNEILRLSEMVVFARPEKKIIAHTHNEPRLELGLIECEPTASPR